MRKLILDTNLLVLYVTGSIDNARQIKNSKKLKSYYTEKDFDFLLELMEPFEEIYITPYIAAETSNLIHRDLDGWAKEQVFAFLRELLINVFKFIEVNPIKDTENYTFCKFGLTDNALLHLIEDYVVLTNDEDITKMLFGIKHENVLWYDLLRGIKFEN